MEHPEGEHPAVGSHEPIATAGAAAIPTTGAVTGWPPMEPSNVAEPKANTRRQPPPTSSPSCGVGAMPTTGAAG